MATLNYEMKRFFMTGAALAICIAGCAGSVESGTARVDARADVTSTRDADDGGLVGPCCVDDPELQELACLEIAHAGQTCECCPQ